MTKLNEHLKQEVRALLLRHIDVFLTSRLIMVNIPELKGDGKLREIINLLRIEGIPIISGAYGYCYTEDIKKVWRFTRAFKQRIQAQVNACSGLMDFCEKSSIDNKNYIEKWDWATREKITE